LLLELRRDVLRRLQRLLHLLGKFIGPHTLPLSIAAHSATRSDRLLIHTGRRAANAIDSA
jgi:hypothetical protein